MSLSSRQVQTRAKSFIENPPHRIDPYNKRNWGGKMHSLCSYQGKLKPAIAHFMIANFTQAGDRVLDPMAGVGTIPLEARRQGRIGLAGDLSPLAAIVSRAKLEAVTSDEIWDSFRSLQQSLSESPRIDAAMGAFGLNGPIASYFHEQTLTEILVARNYFQSQRENGRVSAADAVVQTALMHILHGNRPYALSRRSHSLTPFSPTGVTEYKPVVEYLRRRLQATVPYLVDLAQTTSPGRSEELDFRRSETEFGTVDSVITSPPFTQSFRFWSTNWMRLWFSGWGPLDFKEQPARFLEAQQKSGYSPYVEFADSMARVLRPDGLLVLHLGETARDNMVNQISPLLEKSFIIDAVGKESLPDAERHGLRDKGATYAHWYLFARRR
jgi:hypothetical protein